MDKTVSRRQALKTMSLCAMSAAVPQWSWGQGMGKKEFFVFFGTYTSGESEGIYVYRMDTTSGALQYVTKAAGVVNPSYLAISSCHRYLYAVNEISRFEGQSSGAVSAFSIDQKTGELTFLNQQPSHGASPCYVTVDRTNKWVLIANYTGGNVCALPIEEGGRLGAASDIVQHQGKSVNRRRQNEPHAHCIILDSTNRYAFAADLGIDKIMIYQFDVETGKLKPNDPPFAQIQAGAGPRHFTFHPTGPYAFSIQEINSTITSFQYDQTKGSLNEIQTLSTLPEDYTGETYCADIHVSPCGQYLYGSNRGHDSIAIFKIDTETGKLTPLGHESTQGETPRNFAIDPTGTYLLAANQKSNTIVSFKINKETGQLTATGDVTNVPTPVCIKFMPLSEKSISSFYLGAKI